MDDWRRREILDEARRNVAKLHEVNQQPDVEVEPPRQVPLEVEDRRARSLRFYTQSEVERAEERMRRREAEQEAAKPMGFSELQTKILGEVISELRKQLRDEFAEQIGELRADFHVMRSVDKGDVIDLPAIPLRRRSDAA